jgi:EmrB/QacA subfamily drug resistance transporter
MTAGTQPVADARGAISTRRRWGALAAVALISLLLLLQDTAVSVVLPAVRRDLGLSLGALEWVVNAYAVAVAALTLASGRLADAHGRRRLFLLGIAVFAAGSLLAGLAGEGWIMILARAIQGTGGALAGPAALAIIWSMFGPGERGGAVGLWAGAASLGLGLGPVIGALLSEGLGWRAIFFINVPLVALAWVAAHFAIPESRDARAPRGLPARSVVTSAAAIVALMLALTRAPTAGWTSIGTLSLFAGTIVAGVLFALAERRSSQPLLDRSQLRRPGIVGANVVSLLSTAVMCNLFFFLSLYFQTVRGLTSLGAAGMLLPLTGLIVILSPVAGRLSDHVGRRPVVVAGLVTIAGALGLLSRIAVNTPLTLILFALAITGAGIGLATPPTTAAALDGIPDHQVGQASAVLNTSRALGLSLGIAIMGALLSAGPTNVLNATATTRQTFVSGLTTGLALNAGIALLAAVIALRTLVARKTTTVVAAAPLEPGPG